MKYILKIRTNNGWIPYSDTDTEHVKLFDSEIEARNEGESLRKDLFLRSSLVKRFSDEFHKSDIYRVIPGFKDYWLSIVDQYGSMHDVDVVQVEI